MHSTLFTNGVIAVKEKSLLGEKLFRFAEMSAEEVFCALTESGFGGAAGAVSPADGELLCAGEEEVLDEFIRTYAPSQAVMEYLLAPRDFHNLKALVKARLLSVDPSPMLAPEGLYTVSQLGEMIDAGETPAIPEDATGADVGAVFEKALYARLFRVCRGSPLLKRLLVGKVDRLNILTALRATEEEYARSLYLDGGKLGERELAPVFGGEPSALDGTPYRDFYRLALGAKEKNLPFTEAERALDRFEADYFAAHKYDLAGKEPFLYYVFRRRAEIADVRILLVCLNAGLSGNDIKKRLR